MHNRKMEISKGFSFRRSCQKTIVFLTDEVKYNVGHLIRAAFGGPPSPQGEGFSGLSVSAFVVAARSGEMTMPIKPHSR